MRLLGGLPRVNTGQLVMEGREARQRPSSISCHLGQINFGVKASCIQGRKLRCWKLPQPLSRDLDLHATISRRCYCCLQQSVAAARLNKVVSLRE